MSDKKKNIYKAIIEGATEGLSDQALYAFVKGKQPKASAKAIVRMSFLALSDPELTDRTVLNTIYALAIKHRLDRDPAPDDDESTEAAPAPAKLIKSSLDEAKPVKRRKGRAELRAV